MRRHPAWVGALGPKMWLAAAAGLSALTGVAAPALKTDVDPVCGLPRLALKSMLADNAVELQASDDLGAPGVWETLLRVAPGTQETVWFDPETPRRGRRFYRVEVRPPTEWTHAANFALNDQDGRRHDFLREGDAKAVVLVFTDNAHLAEVWARVRPLHERHGAEGVRFWLVNSTDPRGTLAGAVRDAGVKVPVLHDGAQLVARTWGVQTVGEVVALDRTQFEPFYVGALSSRYPDGTTPEVPHLGKALDEFTTGRTVAVQRVKATGDLLGLAAPRVPDYPTEIAPLVQSRCVGCHRPGDIGSFPMLRHADLVERAREIRDSVLSGSMPPWQADPAHG
ncbi:MAG: redoxin domain-containing protein [Verrucomicrobiota bacterium]